MEDEDAEDEDADDEDGNRFRERLSICGGRLRLLVAPPDDDIDGAIWC